MSSAEDSNKVDVAVDCNLTPHKLSINKENVECDPSPHDKSGICVAELQCDQKSPIGESSAVSKGVKEQKRQDTHTTPGVNTKDKSIQTEGKLTRKNAKKRTRNKKHFCKECGRKFKKRAALNAHIPIHSSDTPAKKPRAGKKEWFNRKCELAKKEQEKAHKKWKRLKTDEARANYTAKRNEFVRVKRQEQRKLEEKKSKQMETKLGEQKPEEKSKQMETKLGEEKQGEKSKQLETNLGEQKPEEKSKQMETKLDEEKLEEKNGKQYEENLP